MKTKKIKVNKLLASITKWKWKGKDVSTILDNLAWLERSTFPDDIYNDAKEFYTNQGEDDNNAHFMAQMMAKSYKKYNGSIIALYQEFIHSKDPNDLAAIVYIIEKFFKV